ncbi:hypothetical protein ACOME3_010324 [Neoechinorhynchus agilis]
MSSAVTSANVLIQPSDGSKRHHRVLLDGLEHAISQVKADRVLPVIFDFSESLAPTLAYASPELISQSVGYCTQTDIYSLGVLACELSNGVNPFDKMDLTQMLLQKMCGHSPMLWDKSCLSKSNNLRP